VRGSVGTRRRYAGRVTTPALDISHSLSGQPWRWRSAEAGDWAARPDDLVTRLLLSRGAPAHDLDRHRAPTLRAFLPDPSEFRDMDAAATRIADAVEAGERTVVFGDYDVDGATSAALLIRLLRALGLDATAYIPDRLTEGYGPGGEALERIAAEGTTLCVTVDCGAQAFEALDRAAAAGLSVVVVDHHQCASRLPVAHALVNPNRLDEGEVGAAHGHLAAVGVCFLLGAALIRTLRARGWFANRPEPSLLPLLDLVALGTVADVARLTDLNRAFVAQGLKVMGRRGNPGLVALAEAAGLDRAPTCSDLGFALGPRINAGGRVGRADLGVRLLTTDDPAEAAAIAAELDHLNRERRAIESGVLDAAMAMTAGDDRAVAVVSGAGWHPGVIGIVAARLKERLGRPAIVVALTDDGLAKGSGRSVPGVDLGAAVLAAKDEGLLIAGGGHAMAAGLTARPERLADFAAFLHDRLANGVASSSAERALTLDALVTASGVTGDLADALEGAGPYGMGWPQPRLAVGPVSVVKADRVGENHVRLIVAGREGGRLKAVAFRVADTPLGAELLAARPDRALWLAGRVKRDDWSGRGEAELHLDDAAWA